MTFALRYWRELALGLAIIVAVTAIAFWRISEAKLGQCNREAKTWAKTNKTQEQSIVTLMEALDRKNAETVARGRELEAARAREQTALQEMDFKARGAQERIDRLNRIADSQNSVCGVSDELREALDGL